MLGNCSAFQTSFQFVVALTLLSGSGGERLPAQAARDSGVVVIHAGRLLDTETGTVVRDQDLIVRNGRIEAIGARLAVPSGARQIDLKNFCVLPGLIDMHTHLFVAGSGP